MWLPLIVNMLGWRTHLFTAGSQDINNRFVASQLLYGSPLSLPVPDVPRTDFLVVIGANPDRVARQRADTAAHQRPDARRRQAGRAGAGHRPPQDRDRRPVRVAGHRARRRCLPAAVAAGRDVRRRPRRPPPHCAAGRRAGLAGGAGRPVHPRIDRGPHRHPAGHRARAGARPGPHSAGRRVRPGGDQPRRKRNAHNLSARRGEPGGRQPRPRRRLDVRQLRPARRTVADEGRRRRAALRLRAQALPDRRLAVGAGVGTRRR